MMGKTNRSSNSRLVPQEQGCYEGERLARLLKSIESAIDSAKLSNTNSLPEKFWYKQQFAIGVNEVTRALERMLPAEESYRKSSPQPANRKPPSVNLQAVLVASDCNPKWLTKHLPGLALSRKVPVIFVKDNKRGSLRLGELLKIKTAIAVGVKDRGNAINQIVGELLSSDVNGNCPPTGVC